MHGLSLNLEELSIARIFFCRKCCGRRPRFKNCRQSRCEGQRVTTRVIHAYALQVFALTETIDQPLQIFLSPVVEEGLHAFLQAFAKNFRATGEIVP